MSKIKPTTWTLEDITEKHAGLVETTDLFVRKEAYDNLAQELKQMSNNYRTASEKRDNWKEKSQEAEAKIARLRAELADACAGHECKEGGKE